MKCGGACWEPKPFRRWFSSSSSSYSRKSALAGASRTYGPRPACARPHQRRPGGSRRRTCGHRNGRRRRAGPAVAAPAVERHPDGGACRCGDRHSRTVHGRQCRALLRAVDFRAGRMVGQRLAVRPDTGRSGQYAYDGAGTGDHRPRRAQEAGLLGCVGYGAVAAAYRDLFPDR